MDSGLYAAYTGLLGRTQALDTAANNLANAGTAGFRAQRDYFRGVIAGGVDQDPDTSSQVGQSLNGYGVLGGKQNGSWTRRAEGHRQPARSCVAGPGLFLPFRLRTEPATRETESSPALQPEFFRLAAARQCSIKIASRLPFLPERSSSLPMEASRLRTAEAVQSWAKWASSALPMHRL